MEFSGRLIAFPIADILQWAATERRTGALVVRRSRREKRVYFRSGEIVACLTDQPAESFGQHLLLNGLLSEGQLIQALENAHRNGRRLGGALLEMKLLPSATIQDALRHYIQEVVLDLFLWRDGVFFFQAEMPPVENLLPQPIQVVGMALEGARWIDEVARIRRILIHDEVVMAPGPSWPGEKLSALERRIARGVGVKRSVQDLYAEVRGSHFRFLEAVYRLAVGAVLDIKEIGDERTVTASRELRLYDLLLEEETTDELLRTREHLIVPIEVLAGFHPVWAHALPPDEAAKLPAVLRQFSSEFDGRKSLRELFSTEPSVLSQQMDGLLLLMRRGRLALLPAPPADLDQSLSEKQGPATAKLWKRLVS